MSDTQQADNSPATVAQAPEPGFGRMCVGAIKSVAVALAAAYTMRPRLTLFLIVSQFVAQVAHLLAFLLPLKIILLAASDGVPRYFPFIDPNHKEGWLVSLTILAVFFYVLNLVLEYTVKRLSEQARDLKRLNKRKAKGAKTPLNMNDEAIRHLQQLTRIAANVAIGVLGYLVVLLLQPVMAAGIAGLALISLLVLALIFDSPETSRFHRIAEYLEENGIGVVQFLSSLAFFVAFFFILYPFVFGEGGSLLIALVSFIVVRQALRAISIALTGTIRFCKKLPDIAVSPEE